MCKIETLIKNERVKTALLIGGVSAVGQLFVTVTLAVVHPSTGEILQNALLSVGLALNALLAGLAALMLFAVFAWNFRKGVRVEFSAPAWRELPAPAIVEPSAPGDIFVFTRSGESADDFNARLSDAIGQASLSRWVVIIQKGNPIGMIYSADEGGQAAKEFDRHFPPFESPGLPELNRCAPEWAVFTQETEAAYREYVRRFSAGWAEWAPLQKLSDETTIRRKTEVFTDISANIARAVSVVLLLLFSVGIFAQSKTRQVDEALGTRIREIPNAGESVTFVFQEGRKEKSYHRSGDGRKTYTELLQTTGGLFPYNDEGGQLLYVEKSGEVVARASAVQDVLPRTNVGPGNGYVTESYTGDPVRPRPVADGSVIQPEPEQYRQLAMPDSSKSAAMAERMKYEIWRAGEYGGRLAKPWWEVVMEAFWVLYPILIILATIAWICARVFSSEGMLYEHKAARRTLVYILLIIAGVMAINTLVWAISIRMHPLGVTGLALAISGIAWYIVSRLSPNFDPAPGNEPERGQANGGSYYPAARR